MELAIIALLVVTVLALFFDFSNGFHDSSNIVATMISSRAISPGKALAMAAIAEFIGAYFLGTAVAKMMGKGIVDPQLLQTFDAIWIIVATLIGAIAWNMLTWYFGIPSSSSHALIGGMIGAFLVAKQTTTIINWSNVLLIFGVLVSSPLVGGLAAALVTRASYWLFRYAPPAANNFFKKLQIFSSLGLALSHGTNDAQKTMGIITLAMLIVMPYYPLPGWMTDDGMLNNSATGFVVPHWVIIACSLAIALGISTGGWSIIKTLGGKLYKVKPINGFAAQAGSGLVIYLAAYVGFPVSTTQIVSSSIMGSGASERPKAVRWGVIGNIMLTWFLTIPAAAIIGGLAYLCLMPLIR